MCKNLLKTYLYAILFALPATSYGSGAINDEDFTLLPKLHTSVKNIFPNEFSSGQIADFYKKLFPDKFTGEQIAEFYKSKQTETPNGTYSVDNDFHQTKPYAFQFITGTYSAFADHISFTGNIEIEENCFWGIYFFKSSYTTYNNATFKVKLTGNSFKLFNLADSVLGDKDFISTPTQPLKVTSFYYIKNTDETWIRQTNYLHRLNGNTKDWLLILAQLQGEDIYNLPETERSKVADLLFQEYLDKKGFILNTEGILSIDQYVDINKDLRTKSLLAMVFILTISQILRQEKK